MQTVVGNIAPEEKHKASHAFHDCLNLVCHVMPAIKALKDSIKKELDELDSGIPPTNVLIVYNTEYIHVGSFALLTLHHRKLFSFPTL